MQIPFILHRTSNLDGTKFRSVILFDENRTIKELMVYLREIGGDTLELTEVIGTGHGASIAESRTIASKVSD